MSKLAVLAVLATLAIFFWLRDGKDSVAGTSTAPATSGLTQASDYVERQPDRTARLLSPEAPLIPSTEPRLEIRSEPTPDPEIRYVSASSLRMRAGPSVKAETLGFYPNATPVTIEERSGNWYRVTARDGQAGWMAARYLSRS